MAVEEMTPAQAWALLESADEGGKPAAFLVDVRTQAEWAFVGVPALTPQMPRLVTLEWQSFPHMQINPDFPTVLHQHVRASGGDETTPLCFLCRSGVRSLHAAQAMEALGYTKTINVTGGFEGDLNGEGKRGSVNGWKVNGLPWRQA
ncbi:MAG: rhodanese-like domain-containing protein [Pseudomonadota bacterium]